MRIQGLLFDKDGTLFDFQATWGGWAKGFLSTLAHGDKARAARLGAAIGYDYASGLYRPDSVMIAGTNEDLAAALLAELPAAGTRELTATINKATAGARMAEVVPLVPLMRGFRARGLKLGLASNDGEAPSRAHLEATHISGYFDFVAGYDSGHGGKPAPGMLLAFARQVALEPDHILMVGDSVHDLVAGRAAGMGTVAVLTGVATRNDLAPFADRVLPDIGYLPAYLDKLGD